MALPVAWQGPDGTLTQLLTSNISAGGMLLLSPLLLPTDRSVLLQIGLPPEGRTVQAQARVRFVGPAQPNIEIGTQLLDMSADDWDAWLRFCQQNSPSGGESDAVFDGRVQVRGNSHLLLVASALSADMLRTLVVSGYLVNVVSDVREALSLLNDRNDIDILICEGGHPAGDGRASGGVLKREQALRNVRVILIADQDTGDELLDELDSVATYVIPRPFSAEFLLALIALCQRS